MGIKSLGKNPVSGFGAGVKETGFFGGKKPGFWFWRGG
jgi:hypothetical protein